MTEYLSPTEQTVFDAIRMAAEQGARCPTNADLINMLPYDTQKVVIRYLRKFEAMGLITVRRWRNARQVTIAATGARTAVPRDVWTRAMLNELAGMAAEGATWSEAERALDITTSTRESMWRQIRHELGPQAV